MVASEGNRRRLVWGAALIVAISLGGCATYSGGMRAVETRMVNGDYAGAIAALDAQKPADRDRVLYLLNRGMILRMQDNFAASNEAFEATKTLSEQLEAISVSEQTSSVTVNDLLRSYVGEPYERLLMHLYKMLNYMELGDFDGARVEALQTDTLQQRLLKGETEEPLSRYLTGVVYEALGEYDEALISYRDAYNAYKAGFKKQPVPVPFVLKQDLLRLTERVGVTDELRQYKEEFKLTGWPSMKDMKEQGELILVLNYDLAPLIQEHSVSIREPERGNFIRISLPYYPEQRARSAPRARADVNGKIQPFDLAEDVDAIARRSLDEKMPGVLARTTARAIVKTKASKEIEKHNGLLGLATNIAGVLSEVADTRSWSTLPSSIGIARLQLAPGVYDLKVQLLDAGGNVAGEKLIKDVQIVKGKKRVKSVYWLTARAQPGR